MSSDLPGHLPKSSTAADLCDARSGSNRLARWRGLGHTNRWDVLFQCNGLVGGFPTISPTRLSRDPGPLVIEAPLATSPPLGRDWRVAGDDFPHPLALVQVGLTPALRPESLASLQLDLS